jgi:hypothetical protein
MEKAIRYTCSDIEDLAFPFRSSRESDEVGRRGCIEHDFAKGLKIRTETGTRDRVVEERS